MLKDLFFDKGKLSSTKTMTILAFIFSTYFVYENVHSQYIVELMALYLGLPYANRQTSSYIDYSQNKGSVDVPDKP